MDWHDWALVAAGVIGSGVAAVHGVLVQRLLVRPIAALSAGERTMRAPVRRLVPVLLHFSTLAWFLGGVALIWAAGWAGREARLTVCLFVGGFYLFAAAGNCWATRGRHPGWMLMAAALALIVLGARP
ncbi:MAG TPA: hypothetical protein VF727_06790 [Allosphingosinicella sp.]|jgi:hypothetical protein